MASNEELHKSKPTGLVLLCVWASEDVSIVRHILASVGAQGVVCADIEDLCRRLTREEVDAVLLMESALEDGALPTLAAALRNQPHWSDLPVLFVTSGGLESPLAVQVRRELSNVLILDRPVRIATLTGALQMALRMRTKQRQVRDLLDEQGKAQEALEDANERLHAQTDNIAALNEQLLTEREELQKQSWELHQLKDRAERTARATERLARLVEENPDPALRVRPDGRIQYKNPASFALCRQWNTGDGQRVPPAVQMIVSEAYTKTEVIRREAVFGKRIYLLTAAPAPPPANSVNIFASDITERKRFEEALRESERRLALALSGTRIGMYDRDLATGRVVATEQTARLLGLRTTTTTTTTLSQEYNYHEWAERVHPEDLAHVEAELQRCLAEHVPYETEYRVLRPDGSVHWVADRGVFHYAPEDQPTRVLGILMGITARKRAEEALRRSEEQFHLLFEEDLTGDFVSTPDGRILLCNPAFAAIFGFCRALDVVGTSVVDLYLDPQEWSPLMERLRQEGKIERLEVWRKRRDGERIHTVENLVSHFDEQGRLHEITAYLFEDTQRKHAEEALRESEQRLRSHMENSPLAVMEWDKDFVVTRWAGEAEKMFGWTAAETVGKPILDLNLIYPEDLPLVARTMERLTDGVSRQVVSANRNVTKTGAVRSCVWYNSVLLDTSGKMSSVLSLVQDITEQKRAEETVRELNATLESKVTQRTAELRQRARQLQKLALEMSAAEDRERERIAHILHDDLQQELAAAKFHLGLLHTQARHDPAVEELASQVNEMLKDAIAKSRSLSHDLSPGVLHQQDLAQIFQWLAEEMQTKHGLTVHVRGQAQSQSEAVRAFLYRTAQELLFNTVKHAQVHEARVRVRRCGQYVLLSVSDRGRGFDPERLRETAGFGLLSIRERIELLGGRMRVHSAPGQGSTFLVVVPESETARPLTGRAQEGPQAAGEEGRLRLVVADDHEVVRQGLVSLLREEYTLEVVGEASNGHEAMELAGRLHPDVVIMDVSMPMMSGEEATRRIKQDLPQTRIVALSMSNDPEVRERICAAGAESYVLKTAPYQELLAAIRGNGQAAPGVPCKSTA